jgi:hypothetical protein
MLGRATSVQSPTSLCDSSLHVTHKTRPTCNHFRTRHANAHHKPFNPYKWRADAAATTLATDETQPRSTASEDKHQLLARLADAKTDVYVGATPLGRGIVSPNDVGRQAIVTVPLHNALVISDSPSDSISIFGDKQHEAWQQHHGKMPDMLLEFLQGALLARTRHVLIASASALAPGSCSSACCWGALTHCTPCTNAGSSPHTQFPNDISKPSSAATDSVTAPLLPAPQDLLAGTCA